jgi:catechol 2,3-dioxygenase-like lactoylglutathione lyase family enzyme
VAQDWQQLARFYKTVFDCHEVPQKRDLSGDWLVRGTGVAGAALKGVHLRLPGHGDMRSTLEIFSYNVMEANQPPAANRKGLGHLAFAVAHVAETLSHLMTHVGQAIGEVVTVDIPGEELTFCYAANPEGNLLELQSWKVA